MQFFACTVKIKRSCKKKIEDLCQQPFSVGRFTVSFMCTIKSKLFLQLHLVEYSKNKKKEENCKYPLQEVGLTGYQKSEKSDIAQHCTRVESLDFGKANRQI